MIIRLMRPQQPGGRKWLLYAPGGVFGFIEATDELERAVEGSGAYFEAERIDDGWALGSKVEDQPW